MRWIEKMNATFFMVSTSSITMQSLRETVQRAPAVGAKIWCLSVLLPAGCHGNLPVLYLLRQWPKISIFAHTGKLCVG